MLTGVRRAGKSTLQLQLMVGQARQPLYCNFVTADEAIQVCFELTEANRAREGTGVLEAARLPGGRRPVIVTFDQLDRLRENGVEVAVVPAWQWLSR